MNGMDLRNNLRTISVEFPGNGRKSYDFISDDESIKDGDTVVCDTRNGLTVGKVVCTLKGTSPQAEKWIVDTVDLTSFEKRKQQAAKAAELLNAMEQRRKGLEQIAVYKMMAEQDPEMKKMYTEYAEIMGLTYDEAIAEMAGKAQ